MFRFANPIYLYLLTLIPVFVAAFVWFRYRRKKNLCKFGDIALLRSLMPDVSTARPIAKFCLMMVAYALLVFILARPQYGMRNEVVKRSGIEAIIAVDVSNSMLCEDISPNRLQKSKMIVSKLIDQLDEDKLGLVAFAGTSVTLLPMTSDYVSAKMFLDQIDPKTISLQGTDMGEAIEHSLLSFSPKQNVGRALILITDAEDNEERAVEAAKLAKEKGVRIFVLSVGTPEGGPIPMGGNNFKKDMMGNIVTTKLNESVGKQIAQAGSGVYIHVDRTDDAQAMLESEINKMQQADFETSMYSQYDEQFIAVAILLLLVILAELCIMERQNRWLQRFRLFKFDKTATVIALAFVSLAASAQNSDRDCIRLGNKYFRDGEYNKAETYYRKALDKNKSLEAHYNLGNALAAQANYSVAFEQFKKALGETAETKEKKAFVYHNMGNLSYLAGRNLMKANSPDAMKMFQQAVESYKSALRLNPSDNETRYNLAMAQHMIKQNQDDQNQDQNKDQNKDQNQDKQDQDKDKQDQNKDQDKDKQDQEKDKQDQNKDQQDQNKDENKDKNQDQQQQPQQQQQQEKDQMDDRTAEQLLNSAQNDEKKVQQKVQKAEKSHRKGLEKDW